MRVCIIIIIPIIRTVDSINAIGQLGPMVGGAPTRPGGAGDGGAAAPDHWEDGLGVKDS